MSKEPLIRTAWQTKSVLGEGPVWSPHHQGLLWVDIKRPAIHLFRPKTDEKQSWPLPQMIGCLAVRPDNTLVAALEDGFYAVSLPEPGTTPTLEKLAAPTNHASHMRFNDGKLAPDGSLWAGSMDNREQEATGAWYRLSPDNILSTMATDFMVTNGPAFDPADNRVFLNDSARQITYVAPLEQQAPLQLSVFRQFEPDDGYPDGMTVGPDGLLWIAFWDGACLRGLDRMSGKTVRQIHMPVPRPTSCAFGGEDGKSLYVTSASIGLSDDELAAAPLSGSLFEITGVSPT
ncbi:SMP-30/gluconolactonase/LRE family protein [Pyruvatibacter sp. HU-CL02332]|uniref:SMP-30/gluconolactonase/LRE family protein n=1 Tax=Pyruvatibacter sp. HU-CL02332 TaxID=3127650 RepID=UPI0033654A46